MRGGARAARPVTRAAVLCAAGASVVALSTQARDPVADPAAQTSTPLSTQQVANATAPKVRFYLPLGVPWHLMTCGEMQLYGRAMGGVVAGEKKQWFDMFQIRINGKEAVIVEAVSSGIRLDSPLQRKQEDAKVADLAVISQDKLVSAILDRLRRVETAAESGQRKLTTLNVTVDGKAVVETVALSVPDTQDETSTHPGDRNETPFNVTVTQDVEKQLGQGYVETVDFDTGDIGVQLESSMEYDRLHLDIAFTKLDETNCSGTLPEIWGIRPMSHHTAVLLNPTPAPVQDDTKLIESPPGKHKNPGKRTDTDGIAKTKEQFILKYGQQSYTLQWDQAMRSTKSRRTAPDPSRPRDPEGSKSRH